MVKNWSQNEKKNKTRSLDVPQTDTLFVFLKQKKQKSFSFSTYSAFGGFLLIMLRQIKKFSDVFGIVSKVHGSWFGSGDGESEEKVETKAITAPTDVPEKKARKVKKTKQLTFQEEAYIMTLISSETQTELAPAIKPIFEAGKAKEMISNLELFIQSRDQEIEKICQSNFSGFIRSVDDLFSVRRGIEEVKHSVVTLNEDIQHTGVVLSNKTAELVDSRIVLQNLNDVIEAITACLYTLSLTHKVREYIENGRFYPAIKILEQIQQVHLQNVSQYEFGRFLEKKIPLMKENIKKRVITDVSSWLLIIRNASGDIGRFSMAQTNATIEKKEELLALRSKDVKEYTEAVITQRKRGATISAPKAPTDLSSSDTSSSSNVPSISTSIKNVLPADSIGRLAPSLSTSALTLLANGADITEVSVFEIVNINFAPLYQCSYIHEVLGEKEEFQKYYKENRKLQANMVLQQPAANTFMTMTAIVGTNNWNFPPTSARGMQTSASAGNVSGGKKISSTSSMRSLVVGSSGGSIPVYAAYLNAIAGFFIIEATVLQTSNDLITANDVTALWDMASNKMRAVLQVEVAYCEDIEALPELKNYLLIFVRTLRKYGYNLNMMNDFIKTALRSRYVNVTLDKLTNQFTRYLDDPEAAVSFTAKNDNQLQEMIHANELHTLFRNDKNKKSFPFSNLVPRFMIMAKQFTLDIYKFCSNLPDLESVVIHGLEQLLKIVATSLQQRDYNLDATIANLGLAIINVYWIQHTLPLLEEHLNQMGVAGQFGVKLDPVPFTETMRTLEENLFEINSRTIDAQFESFLKTCQPQGGKLTQGPRPHIQVVFNEVLNTFPKLKDMPGHTFESMYSREYNLAADRMMGVLLTDRIRYFDLNFVKCLHEDLLYVEECARKAPIAGMEENFAELRQVINLLMQPDQKGFLDPPTRATAYNKITNTKKLASVLRKFKEPGGFGPFSAAKAKRKVVKAVMAQLI